MKKPTEISENWVLAKFPALRRQSFHQIYKKLTTSFVKSAPQYNKQKKKRDRNQSNYKEI